MTFTPKEAYTKAELVSCAQGELFGPGAGRLPSDQMLMFDRILSISKNDDGSNKGQITPSLHILAVTALGALQDPIGVLPMSPFKLKNGLVALRALRQVQNAPSCPS